MKKVGKILGIVIGIIATLAVIVVIGARMYFRMPAKEYYQNSEKAFLIPDIDKGFVPQGISYVEAENRFLLTGYAKGEGASPIYVVEQNGDLVSKALMMKDGQLFACHSGGISIYGDYVYVAGCQDCALYVFSYEEIKKGGNVNCIGTFTTRVGEEDYLNIDCTTVYDGKIILGEFFREENYQTLPSHKMKTTGGDYQQALAVEFALGDYPDTFGIAPNPICAYSIPDQVQGLAVEKGTIYTSSSYGTAMSPIRAYDMKAMISEGSQRTVSLLGYEEIPLYELDQRYMTKQYIYPPMAEEIQFVNGKMYTMCESASDKYFFGKLTGHKWCYRTNLY